jgi:hypothetical protein
MRFASATVFFNDAKSLYRNLKSVSPYFDPIFCIDGPFKGHPSKLKQSDDGSVLVAKAFGQYSTFPFQTEAGKRNLYIDYCHDYKVDWLLILDSDEYITVQDWDRFKSDCDRRLDTKHNVYGIKSKNEYNDQYSFRPRLWHKPYEMEYLNCHYCYGRKDGQEIKSIAAEIEGITVEHDKSLRDQKYFRDWSVFRRYQVGTEGS